MDCNRGTPVVSGTGRLAGAISTITAEPATLGGARYPQGVRSDRASTIVSAPTPVAEDYVATHAGRSIAQLHGGVRLGYLEALGMDLSGGLYKTFGLSAVDYGVHLVPQGAGINGTAKLQYLAARYNRLSYRPTPLEFPIEWLEVVLDTKTDIDTRATWDAIGTPPVTPDRDFGMIGLPSLPVRGQLRLIVPSHPTRARVLQLRPFARPVLPVRWLSDLTIRPIHEKLKAGETYSTRTYPTSSASSKSVVQSSDANGAVTRTLEVDRAHVLEGPSAYYGTSDYPIRLTTSIQVTLQTGVLQGGSIPAVVWPGSVDAVIDVTNGAAIRMR